MSAKRTMLSVDTWAPYGNTHTSTTSKCGSRETSYGNAVERKEVAGRSKDKTVLRCRRINRLENSLT